MKQRETQTGQGFERRWMPVEILWYVKATIAFYKYYGFFPRRHALMNHLCYNNLLQIMQHSNFRNLNRVAFTR